MNSETNEESRLGEAAAQASKAAEQAQKASDLADKASTEAREAEYSYGHQSVRGRFRNNIIL